MTRRGGARVLLAALGAAALAVVLAALAAWGLGRWIDYSQEPRPADMIVVLSGGLARTFYAADLFRDGYAPEVWLSRSAKNAEQDLLRGLGIDAPSEHELSRRVLLRRGVPASAIRDYGDGVRSTAEEALALRAAADTRGKRLLVVTSRFHARRAELIFRRLLKGASVRVCATPYEPFTRRWWTDRSSIDHVVLEPMKVLWFWLGGRFASRRYAE